MRNPFRERLYGLSREAYAERLEEQGGVCALCGGESPDRALAVDHDHQSNGIRGLLCAACNTGLGAFRDNVALLRAACVYLEGHRRGVARIGPALSSRELADLTAAFDMLLEQFTTDVEDLAHGRPFEDTVMRTHLPAVFAASYNLRLAVRFLRATSEVRERLRVGLAYPADSVAQELALHAALRTWSAIEEAEDHDVGISEDVRDRLLPDLDVLDLFDPGLRLSREDASKLGATHLWFEDWFRSFADQPEPGLRALN